MISPHVLVEGTIATILAFNVIKRWINNTIICSFANIKLYVWHRNRIAILVVNDKFEHFLFDMQISLH